MILKPVNEYDKEYHECLKKANILVKSVALEVFAVREQVFEEALDRNFNKSEPLSVEFFTEAKNSISTGTRRGLKVSKKSASQPQRPSNMESGDGIGVKTRRREVTRIGPSEIVEEELHLRDGRTKKKDILLMRCLRESIQSENISLYPIPDEFSAVFLMTESKVVRFSVKEICNLCFFMTPQNEQFFDNKMREMRNASPQERKETKEIPYRHGSIQVAELLGNGGLIKKAMKM